MLGGFADNVGSAGLYPLCMSPLAFNIFYTDMLAAGEDPIMSLLAYKWFFVSVALMVIAGVWLAVPSYNRLGTAGANSTLNSVSPSLPLALRLCVSFVVYRSFSVCPSLFRPSSLPLLLYFPMAVCVCSPYCLHASGFMLSELRTYISL